MPQLAAIIGYMRVRECARLRYARHACKSTRRCYLVIQHRYQVDKSRTFSTPCALDPTARDDSFSE